MRALVRRDVGYEEKHNFLGRDAYEGEVFYVYQGHDYGAINRQGGIALSESSPFGIPFFEFPRDAVDIEGEDFPAEQVQPSVC